MPVVVAPADVEMVLVGDVALTAVTVAVVVDGAVDVCIVVV